MEGFLFLLIVLLYFLPSVVAASRGHHNTGAIIALNILLGWLVIGWIIAFVWSLTYVRPQTNPAVPQPALPPPLPGLTKRVSATPRENSGFAVGAVIAGLALLLLGAAIMQRSASQPIQTSAIPQAAAVTGTTQASREAPAAMRRDRLPLGEAVKREAERVHWCRQELKKPISQRSERTGRVCSDVN